jgi:hypothetical protein
VIPDQGGKDVGVCHFRSMDPGTSKSKDGYCQILEHASFTFIADLNASVNIDDCADFFLRALTDF